MNYPRGLVSEIKSIYNGGPQFSAIQKPLSSIVNVEKGNTKASAVDIFFRDPDYFMTGELHYHLDIWQFLLEDFHKRDEILNYIKNGVSVFDFFKHFKGEFKGKSYDSPYPPKTFIPNSKICDQYEDFISSTIIERVQNGSMSIWGKQGECEPPPPPPHLVMPLTIETTKPRLSHDERFLNLWMDTPKVFFDKITDLLQCVGKGNFQTQLDDKNGYDHISLSEQSRE